MEFTLRSLIKTVLGNQATHTAQLAKLDEQQTQLAAQLAALDSKIAAMPQSADNSAALAELKDATGKIVEQLTVESPSV